MVDEILLNEVPITVTDFYEEKVTDKATGKELRKIGFDFEVTSEAYHKITTLLYEMNFQVKIPARSIEFPATIHTYSTSITNLYEDNQVGDFKLILIEQA